MQGEINCIFMVSILKVLNAAIFFSVFSYFAFCIKLGRQDGGPSSWMFAREMRMQYLDLLLMLRLHLVIGPDLTKLTWQQVTKISDRGIELWHCDISPARVGQTRADSDLQEMEQH